MAKRAITTASLLRTHRELWTVTCRNPFMVGIRDGSLPEDVLSRWLVQDRHFVDGLFSFTCRLLAVAPAENRSFHLEGLRTLFFELGWFEMAFKKRGLDAAIPLHPVCRAYLDFLLALTFEPYTVGLVALWAQYRAYYDAWLWASPGAKRYRTFVREWVSPAFASYEQQMRRAVDAGLAVASPRERAKAGEVFVQVARYELAFWVMTMGTREVRPG